MFLAYCDDFSQVKFIYAIKGVLNPNFPPFNFELKKIRFLK